MQEQVENTAAEQTKKERRRSNRRLAAEGRRAATLPQGAVRRLRGWEFWVVMAIFPLPSTITAIAYLSMHLVVGAEPVDSGMLIYGEPVLSFVLSIALLLPGFAAAALVLFLLARNGEPMGRIGLGWRRQGLGLIPDVALQAPAPPRTKRLRKDLSLLLPVALLVFVIPQFIGSGIVHATHLPNYGPLGFRLPAAFVTLGLLNSLLAGVVEEVVVLGYLVRRLEQRGWSSGLVLLVAVLVRVSYHLYYGPGVVPIVLWATASVLMYRKLRRLLPFILCHFAWDASISIGHFSTMAAQVFIGAFFLLAIACTLLWRKVDVTSESEATAPMASVGVGVEAALNVDLVPVPQPVLA